MKKIIIVLFLLCLLIIPFSASAENYDLGDNIVSPEAISDDYFEAPIIGEFNPRTVSLPLLAIIVGAVDGFNPCAMWILLFLITMLFNIQDKKKRWILGLTFIFTSGIVYLFFMVAWLNLAVFLTTITWIRMAIAIFAITFGMVNVYRYINSLNKDVGCDVTNEKQRSKIMVRVKKVVSQKNFALAILGIIILSASVNILELLCSLGLPLLFTQVLALNDLNTFQYGFYIGLYILFFIINELIIFVIAMKTMSIKGISNKFTKYSHLIGGIIMLLLGLIMAFRPEWLSF